MRLKNLSLTYGTRICKALSDDSRIRILNLLQHHEELCISDIEQILDFTQTKTSRHLNYLKNSGIVNPRKSDQWVFYRIKEEVQDIINQIVGYMDRDHVLKEDIQTLEVMLSNRELAAYKNQRERYVTG
jgi:DNA-binding transcriptional ArsR family regulator